MKAALALALASLLGTGCVSESFSRKTRDGDRRELGDSFVRESNTWVAVRGDVAQLQYRAKSCQKYLHVSEREDVVVRRWPGKPISYVGLALVLVGAATGAFVFDGKPIRLPKEQREPVAFAGFGVAAGAAALVIPLGLIPWANDGAIYGFGHEEVVAREADDRYDEASERCGEEETLVIHDSAKWESRTPSGGVVVGAAPEGRVSLTTVAREVIAHSAIDEPLFRKWTDQGLVTLPLKLNAIWGSEQRVWVRGLRMAPEPDLAMCHRTCAGSNGGQKCESRKSACLALAEDPADCATLYEAKCEKAEVNPAGYAACHAKCLRDVLLTRTR